MKIPKIKKKKFILLGALLLIFLAVGTFGAYRLTQVKTSSTVTPQKTSPTPTPSPGSPGNAGDEAKSSLGTPAPTPKATKAPEATTTPTPITIDTFSLNSPSSGQVHFASMVSAGGTCTFTVSMAGEAPQSASGQTAWDGHSYTCGYTFSGLKDGTWTGNLRVTNTAGVSATKAGDVKVGN